MRVEGGRMGKGEEWGGKGGVVGKRGERRVGKVEVEGEEKRKAGGGGRRGGDGKREEEHPRCILHVSMHGCPSTPTPTHLYFKNLK